MISTVSLSMVIRRARTKVSSAAAAGPASASCSIRAVRLIRRRVAPVPSATCTSRTRTRRSVFCSAGYRRVNTSSAVRAIAPWMPPVRSYPSTVKVAPSRWRQVASRACETRGSTPEGVRSGWSSRSPASRISSGNRPGSRERPARSAGRVIDSRSSARDIGGRMNSPRVKTVASSGRSRQSPEKSARTPSTTTAGSTSSASRASGSGRAAASAHSTRTNARRSSWSEHSVNSSSN